MDWTDAKPAKKKKVFAKKGPTSNEQVNLMKEMQGFKNWKAKEEKKVIKPNTGKYLLSH